MDQQRRPRQIRPRKLFVEAAGILHDPDLRMVDRLQADVLVRIPGAAEDRFPVSEIPLGHQGQFFSCGRNRDAADREVEFPGQRVVHQRRPAGRHKFEPDAERLRQVFGQRGVEPDIPARFRFEIGHRAIIPGRSDQQNAAGTHRRKGIPRRNARGEDEDDKQAEKPQKPGDLFPERPLIHC